MDKKKILIVGRTFSPALTPRAFRTTELAKEFARQGHEVTVVLPKNIEEKIIATFDNNCHIKFEFYGPLTWPIFGRSKWIGDWKRKLGRLLFLLFEYPNIEIFFKLSKFLKRFNGYDLLISIAVPHENHWAVAKIRKNGNQIAKTWVADCGDPFMTNVLETIAPPFYFNYLENSFLEQADFVALPTEGSFEGYNQKYKNKFKVIPQGFSFETVVIIDSKPLYENPTFAYAGGVTAKGIRSLHAFIQVLKDSKKNFTFHIYSNNAKSVLAKEVKGFEKQIVLHDPLSREKLLFELSKMDFLVNLNNGTILNTPSKLIDYALVKRPILDINPISPDKNLIDEFLNNNYVNQLIIRNIDDYNIINVANKFLKLY